MRTKALAALAILFVGMRFLDLDARPMMHDESMFAYYGFLYAKSGHYVHFPLMHGPFQVLSIGAFFRVFGDSAGAARALIACWSLLLAATGVLLWPRRHRALCAVAALSSPIVLYYSRYLHEEIIFSVMVVLGVLGFVHLRTPGLRGALLRVAGAAGLVSLVAVKENAVFVYADGIAFAALLLLVRWFWPGRSRAIRPRAARGPANPIPLRWWLAELMDGPGAVKNLQRAEQRRGKHGKTKRGADGPRSQQNADGAEAAAYEPVSPAGPLAVARDFTIGALLGLCLVLWMYGSTTADGSFTPLANIRASWEYWVEQHREHRISGALHYYLPILLVYELPLVVMVLLGLALDALQRPARVAAHAGALGAWLAVWLVWWVLPAGPLSRVTQFLHVESSMSMLVLGAFIVPFLVWSVLSIKEGRRLSGWMAFWTACSLFQYSSAGEKVPWLAVHILVPLYFTAAWLWTPLLMRLGPGWERGVTMALAASLLLTVPIDLRLIGPRAADPAERLVYNHTTAAFDAMCKQHLRQWQEQAPARPLESRHIHLAGAPTFPGCWYFRHCSYAFSDSPVISLDRRLDLLIGDPALIAPVQPELQSAGWSVSELSLRDHWSAEWFFDDAVAAWWSYYWSRTMWHAPVHYPVTVAESPSRGPSPR